MAGDTGWLKPSLTKISVPAGDPGTNWVYRENLAKEINFAADSWMALSSLNVPETASLVWDWVYPSGIALDGAVITGIEVKLWGYFYEHTGNPDDIECNPIKLRLGPATLIDEGPGNPATRFRSIPYGAPPVFPVRDDPPDVASLITIGGPGNVFDLGANYSVSQFLSGVASNTASGAFHSLIRCGMARNVPVVSPMPPYEVGMYLSHVQMKVYWDVPATIIDMGTDPDALLVSVTKTSDIQVMRKLAAVVVADVIIEQAQLGNITVMGSRPEVNIGLPADLTNGTGFIDSTALPTVVITLSDVDLALLRFSDMRSSPEITVGIGSKTPGRNINMASGPNVNVSLGHALQGLVLSEVDPTIVVSLDANLSADTDMASVPTLYVSTTAYLQGDINLGSECGEAELTTVVSLLANLGYTKGLYSNPNVYVTLNGDGLVAGAALEFSPLVSVTIPFANLGSKFAEPAPDHRTVFKCPVDRTIRITRKDKTIL